MMQEASDRDKAAIQTAMNKVNMGAKLHNNELLNDLDGEEGKVNADDAIYDNGNLNSKDNKLRAQILNNDNLSEEEKRRLLQNQ
jgi:hypothetical protein